MYTFKLLQGRHHPGDGHTYKRGDVVRSEKELDKQFGSDKFLRLDSTAEAPKAVEVDDEFSTMTVSELKKFAEEEEIDLEGASRKEEILAVIRRAVASM